MRAFSLLTALAIAHAAYAGNTYIQAGQFDTIERIEIAAGALYACSKDEALNWEERKRISRFSNAFYWSMSTGRSKRAETRCRKRGARLSMRTGSPVTKQAHLQPKFSSISSSVAGVREADKVSGNQEIDNRKICRKREIRYPSRTPLPCASILASWTPIYSGYCIITPQIALLASATDLVVVRRSGVATHAWRQPCGTRSATVRGRAKAGAGCTAERAMDRRQQKAWRIHSRR